MMNVELGETEDPLDLAIIICPVVAVRMVSVISAPLNNAISCSWGSLWWDVAALCIYRYQKRDFVPEGKHVGLLSSRSTSLVSSTVYIVLICIGAYNFCAEYIVVQKTEV